MRGTVVKWVGHFFVRLVDTPVDAPYRIGRAMSRLYRKRWCENVFFGRMLGVEGTSRKPHLDSWFVSLLQYK